MHTVHFAPGSEASTPAIRPAAHVGRKGRELPAKANGKPLASSEDNSTAPISPPRSWFRGAVSSTAHRFASIWCHDLRSRAMVVVCLNACRHHLAAPFPPV